MGAAFSLIPELEQVVQHGSHERRVGTLESVTALFLHGAASYRDEHVDLFDDIFGLLIEEIETKALAELSRRLASVDNAPVKLLRTLAHDDDITVAGPVLKLAPGLAEADLIGVARTKSQAHLKAISGRKALAEALTDELVRRGDREVARCLVDNRGARISEKSFYRLVKRAEEDDVLAEKVGRRPDIPLPMFRDLLTKATAVVQKRLLASATPEVRAAVCDVLVKVSKEIGARVGPRDYRAAQREVLSLHRDGQLNETTLNGFCSAEKYEQMVAALAALAKVPIEVVDRLMSSDRADTVLILCKAVGLSWGTVKAIIIARPDGSGTSSYGLDAAFDNYGRLSASTAHRVVRFWQVPKH